MVTLNVILWVIILCMLLWIINQQLKFLLTQDCKTVMDLKIGSPVYVYKLKATNPWKKDIWTEKIRRVRVEDVAIIGDEAIFFFCVKQWIYKFNFEVFRIPYDKATGQLSPKFELATSITNGTWIIGVNKEIVEDYVASQQQKDVDYIDLN